MYDIKNNEDAKNSNQYGGTKEAIYSSKSVIIWHGGICWDIAINVNKALWLFHPSVYRHAIVILKRKRYRHKKHRKKEILHKEKLGLRKYLPIELTFSHMKHAVNRLTDVAKEHFVEILHHVGHFV